ncbi:sensor histidine kinase [Zavarzinia sp. CC-PAN008]|uniref:sensor histidine kinase n=1 Tax=Zavarzinia sp. CC-PAN008 TaxID=3243332 RepID=UPI003F74428C
MAARNRRSLSIQLLLLTVSFVLISQCIVLVPSLARARADWLDSRLMIAETIVRGFDNVAPGVVLSPDRIGGVRALSELGIQGATLAMADGRRVSLGIPGAQTEVRQDLRQSDQFDLVSDAFARLVSPPRGLVAMSSGGRAANVREVEIVIDEALLHQVLAQQVYTTLNFGFAVALVIGGIIYFALDLSLVRPVRRLTQAMETFRRAPEKVGSSIVPTSRTDEIGQAELELALMQSDLRQALKQREHQAALGAAVAKINHDLRNMLSSAQLVSDRLATSTDPETRRQAVTLLGSLDRAITLTSHILDFAKAEQPRPRPVHFHLAPLVDEVGQALGFTGNALRFANAVDPDLIVQADPDQLFRALMNLARNAFQALEARGHGELKILAEERVSGIIVIVADDGPGLPEKALQHLFRPFFASARSGGTGLGLVIARDLLRAHGGDLTLGATGASGTVFRIDLPQPLPGYS